MRLHVWSAVAGLALLFASSATAFGQGAELAPTGVLRACLNTSLAFVAGANPSAGLQGPVVDLVQELARRSGVPLAAVGYANDAQRLARVAAGECDLTSHAEPASAEAAALLDGGAPLFDVDLTYLVPAGSRITSAAAADQPGMRLAVTPGAPAQVLPGTVRQAELMLAATTQAAFDLVASGEADALAALRSSLIDLAPRLPGSRILGDRFGVQQFGFAVPKGRAARLALVNTFTEQIKATGFAQATLGRYGNLGAQVSPTVARAPAGLPRTGAAPPMAGAAAGAAVLVAGVLLGALRRFQREQRARR